MRLSILVALFAVAALWTHLVDASRDLLATCPPAGFDTLKNFDLKKFVAASPFYVQQQVGGDTFERAAREMAAMHSS
jgi:hypothetical protein